MYTVDKIIFNQLSNNHIPYFIGMIVTGPRGCKYLFDIFNSEKVIRHLNNWYTIPDTTDNIMKALGQELNRYCIVSINCCTEKEAYNSISKLFGVNNKFIRKQVREEELQQIINNVSI